MRSGPDDPVRLWFAGADPDALLAELDRYPGVDPASNGVQGNGSGATRAGRASLSAGTGPARLGIVDPNERKLRLARRLVAKGERWRGRSDIWFSPAGLALADRGTPSGKVAFLFPGVEPTFEAAATDLPALADRFGLEAPDLDDTTVAHRSASIIGLGLFLDDVLRQVELRPDVFAGHSIGEWSGTVAAGLVPRERAGELTGAADLDGIRFPEVDFAALSAGADAAAAVVAETDGVDLSHDNSPRQAVICGPPDRISVALEKLQAAGILGYRLPFRSGFHTPAISPLVKYLQKDIEGLPFGPAEVPLWSATTVAPYPDHREEIADLHLRHLVETVRFRPLVERLYHEVGVRIFVQIGLGSLTGFVDQTLDGLDHLAVPLLSTKHSALAQLHRALTALWVEGVAVSRAEQVTRQPKAAPAAPVEPVLGGQASLQTVQAAAELLSAAAHASRDVLATLALRLHPPRLPSLQTAAAPTTTGLGSAPVAVAALTSAPAPPATQPDAAWPTETVTLNRHMSLETMPETLDHRLYRQPDLWPDPSDGFPIVAMTTQIQLLQDIAASYAGDRDVVEVSGIRNSRWLDLSDPQDVPITVTPKGHDVLAMALGQSCRANVRVGRYPSAPRPDLAALTQPRTPAHTAEELFEQGLMFHGPRYWGITRLGPIGGNGMAGVFHHLETPGSLLDNLGKLIAYWVMAHRNLGEAALPIGVDKIRFFGPDPAPGTELRCEIRIVDLQSDAVTADGTLVLPDGTLWCQVERWTSIVFHQDEVMEPMHYAPTTRFVTEPQPGGWNLVLERWPSGPGRELTARRYLARTERQTFQQMNLLQQRRHILDAICAKDSVRQWLRDTYQIACYPFEITLVPDGDGRFRAESDRIPAGHDLRIAVSGVDWLTVGALSDGGYRDIEARLIPDGADPGAVGYEVADAVASRNVGLPVHHVSPVTNIVPSRIEAVSAPAFAVAWTQE